jgi:hypothetical protein
MAVTFRAVVVGRMVERIAVDGLASELLDVLNGSGEDDLEIHIWAVIRVLQSMLGSIKCDHCRELVHKSMEDALKAAMERPEGYVQH